MSDDFAVSFVCVVCGMTSYSPDDIREGYCGNCHDWTSEEKLAAANALGHPVTWSPYRGSAVCPGCGSHELEVRQVFRLRPPGDWSLAGYQEKYPATIGWQYRCMTCRKTGPAEPK